MPLFSKVLRAGEGKTLKQFQGIVAAVNDAEPRFEALSDQDLAAKTIEYRSRAAAGESLEDLEVEAFAAVREAAKRVLGQRHFDVQVIGAAALHKGMVAEMKTGEGKTLVSTMPAYLNALSGRGVHLVTVNDYLASRDAEWMGAVHRFLGLDVGLIQNGMSSAERQPAYAADITYGTNNEFGFDYLRDNMAMRAQDRVQRGHVYAIVDEVDSILIDEARTPLIISGNTGQAGELYTKFADIARRLEPETDYEVDEKLRAISMTDAGITHAEKLLGIDNIYTDGGVKYVHHLETAVKAKALYHKDKEYVVRDNEVVIVDAFTGRLQPGRRWSEGLHQAIEAKEGTRIKEESRTYASITFQNFFRMYKKLGGMTGTAETSKEEFYKVYGLETYVIPTNRAIARVDHQDLIFQTHAGKMKAVAKKVTELRKKGQPVLIGTVSIEHNELLSEYLKANGVPHEVLNAKNHEREGEIIAQAGRKGAVTIATNMAGRGVDIKLGGNPSTQEQYEEVKALGGLFVLGTERHDARRIDNQLRGRAGRQGDPGETQFVVSLEDSLMRIFAVDMIKGMMGRFNIAEDEPIENKLITNALEKAQEKIEGFNFDARKHTLEYDDVLNFQRGVIYGRRRAILLGGEEAIRGYLAEVSEGLEPELRSKFDKRLAEADLSDPRLLGAVQGIILRTIDLFWVEHLEMMEYLRSSVNLRAYGQRDPLVEYKREGLRYFRDMEASIQRQVGEFVSNLNIEGITAAQPQAQFSAGPALAKSSDIPSEHGQTLLGEARPSEIPGVGRNDLCPWGSGKKYKKCGLLNTPEHQRLMAGKK